MTTINMVENSRAMFKDIRIEQFFMDGKNLMQKIKDTESGLTYALNVEIGCMEPDFEAWPKLFPIVDVEINVKYIHRG